VVIFAEVADKCLAPAGMVAMGSLIGLLTIVLGAWRRAFILLVVVLAGFGTWSLWTELTDPSLGLILEVGERRLIMECVALDAPVVVFALLALPISPQIKKIIRMGMGLCPFCRYDLRATLESKIDRCPECGRKIPPQMIDCLVTRELTGDAK
jgi:hypothetical protein